MLTADRPAPAALNDDVVAWLTARSDELARFADELSLTDLAAAAAAPAPSGALAQHPGHAIALAANGFE